MNTSKRNNANTPGRIWDLIGDSRVERLAELFGALKELLRKNLETTPTSDTNESNSNSIEGNSGRFSMRHQSGAIVYRDSGEFSKDLQQCLVFVVEDTVRVEKEYFDRITARLDSALNELETIKETNTNASLCLKPILTYPEAAKILDVSTKRLQNIIYEEKSRLGHLPDFVCDANGVIQHRIATDRFIDWVKQQKRHPGRRPRGQKR
jgi:hypothetical protein